MTQSISNTLLRNANYFASSSHGASTDKYNTSAEGLPFSCLSLGVCALIPIALIHIQKSFGVGDAKMVHSTGDVRGRVAEWSCRGLQILVYRFDSGLDLQGV